MRKNRILLATALLLALAGVPSCASGPAPAQGFYEGVAPAQPNDAADAEKGDVYAALRLGFSYVKRAARNSSPEQPDNANYAMAAKYLQKAADGGNVKARVKLGSLYEEGLGVKPDGIAAARNYRIAADAGDPEGQIALANLWCKAGANAEDAEAFAKKALSQRPNIARYHATLGVALQLQGKTVQGQKEFDAAKELAKGSPAPLASIAAFYESKAASLLQGGAAKESADEIEKAMGFVPADEQMLSLYVQACLRQGAPKRANDFLDARIADAPGEADPYLARARMRKISGEVNGAVSDYLFAIKYSNDSATRLELSELYMVLDRKEQAFALCNEALMRNPSDVKALWQRALIRLESGDFAGAASDFDAIAQIEPENARALTAEAGALCALKQLDKAIEVCGDALKADPLHYPALLCRADALMASGKQDEAEADCARAIAIDPNNPLPYLSRGRMRMASGRENEALKDFDEVLRLAPDSFPALSARAGILLKQGKPKEAAETLAGPFIESNYALLLMRADAEALSGNFQATLDDSDKALAINSDNPAGWLCKASAFLALKRFKEAEYSAARAIDLGDSSPAPLFIRGRARLELGLYDKAIADFGAIVDLDPVNPAAYLARASAKSLSGRHADSIQDYKKAHELDPASVSTLLDLSEALLMSGKPKEAALFASKALEFKPANASNKAVALYLKSVAGIILEGNGDKDGISDLDKALKEGGASNWNTDAFERWLETAQLPADSKKLISQLTDKVKSKPAKN